MPGFFARQNRVWVLAYLSVFLAVHLYVKLENPLAPRGAVTKIGEAAKPFEAQILGGGKLNLSEVAKKNKLTVVSFWETWCPPCLEEMPELQKMYEANQSNGLEIVAVYGASQDEEVSALVHRLNLSFPIVKDENHSITAQYAVSAVPTIVVVDNEMKVLRRQNGFDAELKQFLIKQLEAKHE